MASEELSLTRHELGAGKEESMYTKEGQGDHTEAGTLVPVVCLQIMTKLSSACVC